MKFVSTILFTFNLGASTASADSVNNAFLICQVFDATGLLSEPCSVSGWNSSIDVKMDTNGREARKMCSGIASMIQSKGINFDDGWRVRIYSPFSGESTIAQCNL